MRVCDLRGLFYIDIKFKRPGNKVKKPLKDNADIERKFPLVSWRD